MEFSAPYFLFLGDARDPLSVKTSRGIADWRPDKCIGEISMPDCPLTLGLPQISFAEAAAKGAKTFVLGLANRGGFIAPEWVPYLMEALAHGMDIASGLHGKVADIPEVKQLADKLGRRIFDVRHPTGTLDVGSGRKRAGKRILAVGTDCSVGKMYTTLAVESELKARGEKTDFRATGQTGILINGQGISVDAVVADFISGAVEMLSPANDPDHWDVIEGQGSLFHPSYAGVSLGLLHGAQADVLILCHQVGRTHVRKLEELPLPDFKSCIETNLAAARLTNPDVIWGGISVNSSALGEEEALEYCREMSALHNVPCVDPVRHGTAALVDYILEHKGKTA
ncbi:N-acetyltransferase DgcN [Paremcibacter congregatus]|uniref:N-acetyltransferase DgcN n=1 Tax=Paremcibacter congregatus TaxID=2043170 RepID=UPI0030EB4D63|tara:strand:- start:11503 stop:12522 length:1020 start_codon:yes stop_codon:yes gene_type:complete